MEDQKIEDVPAIDENCVFNNQAVIEVPQMPVVPNEIFERSHLLTIDQYILETKFNIDGLWINKLWNSWKNPYEWFYLEDDMIKLLGYKGKNFKTQKLKFVNLLKSKYKENVDYKIAAPESQDGNPKRYSSSSQVDLPDTTVEYYVTWNCFAQICMRIDTERGDEIRSYFTKVDFLFKMYGAYQTQHDKIIHQKTLENERREKLLIKDSREATQKENMALKRDNFNLTKNLSKFQTMHNYHKFDKRQPVFYFVAPQRLPDTCNDQFKTSMEVGISGISNKDGTMISCLDERLFKHRKAMNTLRIHMLVWFKDPIKVKLLEKAVKVMFINHSNPHGGEVFIWINPWIVDRFIKNFLAISTWKENEDYFFEKEDELEKYNSLADAFDKNVSVKVPDNHRYSWFGKNDACNLLPLETSE